RVPPSPDTSTLALHDALPICSNPEAAVQEVEQLNAQGVAAIVGGFASPVCLAASQAASRYNLPYIVDVGVTDQIIQRGLKNTFRSEEHTSELQSRENLVCRLL